MDILGVLLPQQFLIGHFVCIFLIRIIIIIIIIIILFLGTFC